MGLAPSRDREIDGKSEGTKVPVQFFHSVSASLLQGDNKTVRRGSLIPAETGDRRSPKPALLPPLTEEMNTAAMRKLCMNKDRSIRNFGVPLLALVVGIGIGLSGRGWLGWDAAERGPAVESGSARAASATVAELDAPSINAAEFDAGASSVDPAEVSELDAPATAQEPPVDDGRSVADVDDPVGHWISQTRAKDWPERWDAVNELGLAGDARGIPALAYVALHDDNPHPRWRSLWAIGNISDDANEALPLLLEPLESSDACDRVRYNAAVALAFFGDASGVTLLQESLEHEDSFQRWEAVYSLGILKDSGSTELLDRRLDHENESSVRIRGETALVLGRIAAPGAAAQLLRALSDDPAHEVRWRAAMALIPVGSAEDEPALRDRLAEEDHSEVREWIEKAIEAIGN